jgi:transposase
MRRKRRNHSPAFKAKVAMAALQGDKTLAELSSQYDIHVNQIQTWRNQLKDNIGSLFDSGIDQRKDHEQQIKSLQAQIGQRLCLFGGGYGLVFTKSPELAIIECDGCRFLHSLPAMESEARAGSPR